MPLKMLMILETPSVGGTSFISYQVWYLLKEATPLCSQLVCFIEKFTLHVYAYY